MEILSFQINFEKQSTFYIEKETDYFKDLTEIRSMMERSSKFLSLSGWAGILAGVYALIGAYIANTYLHFNPKSISYQSTELINLIGLGSIVLIVALITAILFSKLKGSQKGESIWNATSRRLLASMFVPLLTGGIILIVFIAEGLLGLILPTCLVFYGLALYSASKFTLIEVKWLGFIQLALGLFSFIWIEFGLIAWSLGFGLTHIVYGLYIYLKFEK